MARLRRKFNLTRSCKKKINFQVFLISSETNYIQGCCLSIMAEKKTTDEILKKATGTATSQPPVKATNSPQLSYPASTATTKESNSPGLNGLSEQNRSIFAPSNQVASKSIIESANKVCSKTASSNLESNTSKADSTSQLRSTLAIGQLIASNRPTAGSRLVASELRLLTKTIAEESATLRKEIGNLSISLSDSLKSIIDEDREQRSMTRGFYRRPMFAQIARKSFPVYQRRGRGGFSMKQGSASSDVANASTNTPLSPGSPSSSGVANKTGSPRNPATKRVTARKQVSSPQAYKLTSLSAKLISPAKALGALFKNGWFPPEQVFIATNDSDTDTDTDSIDTNPSSSP